MDLNVIDNLDQVPKSMEEKNLNTRFSDALDVLETFSNPNLPEPSLELFINEPDDIPNIDIYSTRPQATDSVNDLYKYLKEGTENFKPVESNDTTYNSNNNDEQLAMNRSNSESLPVERSRTENYLPSKSSISLSNCVDVLPERLQIVFPLEATYRARYKSDYFPQNGENRRPRYIADFRGNHFITLKLPTDCQHDRQNQYIRVALITTFIEGQGHFYSPYKFQIDHNDLSISDENPIYIKVDTNQERKSFMKLHLVLIKSKLDYLNYVQPLKLFSDMTGHIQNIIHEKRLTPKELINQYQLDKSHLAFTLCTKQPDGMYQPNSGTTVFSTIITETTASRRINESVTTPSVDVTTHICCPQCSHQFDPDTPSGSQKSTREKSSRKMSYSSSKAKKKDNNKKKKTK